MNVKGTFNCSVQPGSRNDRKTVTSTGLHAAKAGDKMNHLVVEKGRTNAGMLELIAETVIAPICDRNREGHLPLRKMVGKRTGCINRNVSGGV